MAGMLIYAVSGFFRILTFLIIGRAILSWFIRGPYGQAYQLYMLVGQVTEPILEPCRRLLARFGLNGMVDFSPLLAIFLLNILQSLVVRLLLIFFAGRLI